MKGTQNCMYIRATLTLHMRVSFFHTFFVNRGEIVNVVFDLLTNGSEKVVKPKKKKLKKNVGQGQPSFLSPAAP